MLTLVGPGAPVILLAGVSIAGIDVARVGPAGIFGPGAGIAAAGIDCADIAYLASIVCAGIGPVAGIDLKTSIEITMVLWVAIISFLADVIIARGVASYVTGGVAACVACSIAASAAAGRGCFAKRGQKGAGAGY